MLDYYNYRVNLINSKEDWNQIVTLEMKIRELKEVTMYN